MRLRARAIGGARERKQGGSGCSRRLEAIAALGFLHTAPYFWGMQAYAQPEADEQRSGLALVRGQRGDLLGKPSGSASAGALPDAIDRLFQPGDRESSPACIASFIPKIGDR